MEQMITDFFIKAFELILHNRLPPRQAQSSLLSGQNGLNSFKFQLNFDHDPTFRNLLPSEWNCNSDSKFLAIEIFLTHRSKQAKSLIERWTFDMNEIFDNKIEHTIDSITSLYQKLSTLFRTISLLTITLPVYQRFIRDRNGSIGQSYKLEYSINSTKNISSDWHPNEVNGLELAQFKSPDFVIPGHIFTFSVEYAKSFKFLQKFQEIQEPARNKIKLDAFPFNQAVDLPRVSEGGNVKDLTLVRKAWSDTHFNKEIRGVDVIAINDSPPSDSNFNEEDEYENYGAIHNIPMNIQLKAQKSAIEATHNRLKSRRSFDVRMCETGRGFENSRLRIKTLESERLAELDVYIYENEEDEFTEVLSWQDMSIRNKESTEPDESGTEIDEQEIFRKISEDYEKNKRRLSNTTRPMDKIVERNEDDKVAEILASIEGLKNLSWALDYGQIAIKHGNTNDSDEDVTLGRKGFKFGPIEAPTKAKSCSSDPFTELDELKDLYIQIKRREPIN